MMACGRHSLYDIELAFPMSLSVMVFCNAEIKAITTKKNHVEAIQRLCLAMSLASNC